MRCVSHLCHFSISDSYRHLALAPQMLFVVLFCVEELCRELNKVKMEHLVSHLTAFLFP